MCLTLLWYLKCGLSAKRHFENKNKKKREAKFSTPVLEWMREHCAEYGFILRYPEGREEYTGRDPEPGHFRYVGEVAAEYIMRKGITLEEFKDAYDESKNDPWAKKDDK